MKAYTHNMISFTKFNTVFGVFYKTQVVVPTVIEGQTGLKPAMFITSASPVTHEWKKLVLHYLFEAESQAKASSSNKEEETRDKDTEEAAVTIHLKQVTFVTLAGEVASPPTVVIPNIVTDSSNHSPTQTTLFQPTSMAIPPTIPPTQQLPNITSTVPESSSMSAVMSLPSVLITSNIQVLTLEQFVIVVATITQTSPKTAKESSKEEKKKKSGEMLDMCKSIMYSHLICMYRLALGEDDRIPGIWKEISDKDMKMPMKKSIIKQQIATHKYYTDTKVILCVPFVLVLVGMDFD